MAAVGSHHDKIRFEFPGNALNLRRGVTNGRKLPAFRHTEDSPQVLQLLRSVRRRLLLQRSHLLREIPCQAHRSEAPVNMFDGTNDVHQGQVIAHAGNGEGLIDHLLRLIGEINRHQDIFVNAHAVPFQGFAGLRPY